MRQNFFSENLSVWTFFVRTALARFWSWLMLSFASSFIISFGIMSIIFSFFSPIYFLFGGFFIGLYFLFYGLWLHFSASILTKRIFDSPNGVYEPSLFRSVTSIKRGLLFRLMMASFLVGVLTMFGWLLIIPGVIVSVRCVAVIPLLVDNEKMGVVEAIKTSWCLTQGRFGKVFWFFVGRIFLFLPFFLLGLSSVFSPIARFALYKELQRTKNIA